MAGTILLIILMIPVYWALIYAYLFPEESILWGQRWKYDDEPEVSDLAITVTKTGSLIGIIVLSVIIVISLLPHFL
ncbi:hypothetical protein J2S74_000056 [Evansella vedderi]|uniref:DUF6199 domain-containing protein n=1 Tax=Evansella vedderi TaxID=38282 RepID=A0ABT9ZPA6_9BACI|nr:hypothetical protein [Evansella vedderi]MDQ0252684.1 hypothetical protein [Evansella vedderi]